MIKRIKAMLPREHPFLWDLIQLAAVGAAVVSLALAFFQLRDARKQADTLHAMSQSLETRFLGNFPENLKEINRVLSSLEEFMEEHKQEDAKLIIATDHLVYGFISNHEDWWEYYRLLRRLRHLGVTIDIVYYSEKLAAFDAFEQLRPPSGSEDETRAVLLKHLDAEKDGSGDEDRSFFWQYKQTMKPDWVDWENEIATKELESIRNLAKDDPVEALDKFVRWILAEEAKAVNSMPTFKLHTVGNNFDPDGEDARDRHRELQMPFYMWYLEYGVTKEMIVSYESRANVRLESSIYSRAEKFVSTLHDQVVSFHPALERE